jgi:cytochrome b
MTTASTKLDVPTRVLHLGLVVFGVWAWWIGEGAHDYHKPVQHGYFLHMYVGLTFSAFLLARLLYGLFGPRESRFSAWVPYTRERLAQVKADLMAFTRFRLPDPVPHQGLNALIQSLGLLLFTWQGASGALMAIMIVPGQRSTGWLDTVQDIHHEWGGVWIPAYLVLHVGAAALHALAGRQIWKKMIFLAD